MLVAFALILLALALFATERFPIDVTAILVMVLDQLKGVVALLRARIGVSLDAPDADSFGELSIRTRSRERIPVGRRPTLERFDSEGQRA